jgi:hypothetical protein
VVLERSLDHPGQLVWKDAEDSEPLQNIQSVVERVDLRGESAPAGRSMAALRRSTLSPT